MILPEFVFNFVLKINILCKQRSEIESDSHSIGQSRFQTPRNMWAASATSSPWV